MTPLTKLHVDGSMYLPLGQSYWIGSVTDANNRLRMHHNGTDAYIDFYPTLRFRYGSTDMMYLNNVGLSLFTLVPTAALTINGRINVTSSSSSANFEVTCGAGDPRITTDNPKIVFYKKNGTGYVNIDCGTLTEFSDSTAKTNIQKISIKSLDGIKRLNGYTYNWKNDVKGKKQVGLIAQEVEKIFPELVYTSDSSGIKTISYTHMIPYLLEAIKEQQQQLDEKDVAYEKIQQQIDDLQLNINACCKNKVNESSLKSNFEGDALLISTNTKLYQNAPNPFKESTLIKLEIPQTVSNAIVCIYDLTGKQLKCMSVTGRGITSVQIFGNELSAGMYHYALITDGSFIDTKTMILTEK